WRICRVLRSSPTVRRLVKHRQTERAKLRSRKLLSRPMLKRTLYPEKGKVQLPKLAKKSLLTRRVMLLKKLISAGNFRTISTPDTKLRNSNTKKTHQPSNSS